MVALRKKYKLTILEWSEVSGNLSFVFLVSTKNGPKSRSLAPIRDIGSI